MNHRELSDPVLSKEILLNVKVYEAQMNCDVTVRYDFTMETDSSVLRAQYNSNRPRVYLFCSSILQTEFFIPSGILFFIIKLKFFNPNLPRALG